MPKYDPAALRWEVSSWSPDTVTISGAEIVRHAAIDLAHPDWPGTPRVRLHIGVDPTTGPVATGVRWIEDEAQSPMAYDQAAKLVTDTAPLRELLRTLVAEATRVRVAAKLYEMTADSPDRDQWVPALRAASRQHGERAWQAAQPQRRRTVTRVLLVEVAKVYRKAQTAGSPPTLAVADHFSVSHRTATRWATEARRAGLLEEGRKRAG